MTAMLTGGYLSKLVLLVTVVGGGYVRNRNDLAKIRFLRIDEQEPLLKLAAEVGVFESYEPFLLNESGKRIKLAYEESRACAVPFRIILAEYIRHVLPSWAFRIPAGRMELTAILPPDVASCFYAAELLKSSPDDSIVNWWSELARFVRMKIGEQHEETGRDGEVRSMRYERVRTGLCPKWISFESNFAGYDILSVNSASDETQRLIEVKSSIRTISEAIFVVSANEWEVARHQLDRYRFHLWSFSDDVRIADISARMIVPHIPSNQQEGVWNSVSIPFSAFSGQFIPNPI